MGRTPQGRCICARTLVWTSVTGGRSASPGHWKECGASPEDPMQAYEAAKQEAFAYFAAEVFERATLWRAAGARVRRTGVTALLSNGRGSER